MLLSDPQAKTPEERTRKWLALALIILIAATQDEQAKLTAALVSGEVTPWQFGQAMVLRLAGAHANAGYIGRQLAGQTAPYGFADQEFGRLIAVEQSTFVRGFVEDITNGRYRTVHGSDNQQRIAVSTSRDGTGSNAPGGAERGANEPTVSEVLDEKAIARRAMMYALRLRGSAYQTWAMSLPPDTLVYWRLGPVEEDHCTDCPRLARKGPYTAGTLPTYPGVGSTTCLTHCKCHLETADGLAAFVSTEISG